MAKIGLYRITLWCIELPYIISLHYQEHGIATCIVNIDLYTNGKEI